MVSTTRFAPSPTGPMHFGSLFCAFISYLVAKKLNLNWLVRMEDIDRQRCKDDYAQSILKTLESHQLLWDGDIVYQSNRTDLYEYYLTKLDKQKLIYACDCTRKSLAKRASFYDRYCLNRNIAFKGHAIRFLNTDCQRYFEDAHFDRLDIDSYLTQEDPVLRRADGEFNYNLAAIVDDIEQDIDFIIRGSDLIELTPLHINLFRTLSYQTPTFMHLPVASHSRGVKYSKQSFSPAIDNNKALDNLKSCVSFIGVSNQDYLDIDTIDGLFKWTLMHWDVSDLPRKREIIVSQLNGIYCPEN